MTDERFPHLRSVSDQDGGVILDLRRGTISLLNPTGAFVWERFRAGLTSRQIVLELAKATAMAEEAVAGDVFEFLRQLGRAHLDVDEEVW